jgi:hypothetical protein
MFDFEVVLFFNFQVRFTVELKFYQFDHYLLKKSIAPCSLYLYS